MFFVTWRSSLPISSEVLGRNASLYFFISLNPGMSYQSKVVAMQSLRIYFDSEVLNAKATRCSMEVYLNVGNTS